MMRKSMSSAELARMPSFTTGRPRIAYEAEGHGAAIIFIHGIGGDRSNWDRQMAHFGDRYRVISLDVRGYGESDNFDGSLTFDAMAADVAAVLDAENVDRAHLVGLSMGGMIAQWFWHRHPERVTSLTLADSTVGPAASLTEEQLDAFLESRRAPLLAGATMAEIAERNTPSLLSEDAAPELLVEARASFAGVPATTYLRSLECVTRFAGVPDFGAMTVPVLVMVGESDRSLPVPLSRELAAKIPSAELHIIEGAGHLSNMETPGRFNRLLEDFLAAQG
ncbi:alpha/beta hydrolase fold [Rhizorhabdus wittichii RW1]|uniref:Alpha/beta hydrolase fold n=1 Tax=Rhizorhabdus wittichii (strain DSM 6014 / CCUG 31198 / JCM 15750 / NBRC 105917 / EY 4224 / RW1) TaxID=392499 RepID=A0A9J9HA78_RHIWR|nr:alpha/beta hydrolase fold [Rhizorhabdus wittichii RW1]